MGEEGGNTFQLLVHIKHFSFHRLTLMVGVLLLFYLNTSHSTVWDGMGKENASIVTLLSCPLAMPSLRGTGLLSAGTNGGMIINGKEQLVSS